MAKLIEVEERDLRYIFSKPKPYSLDVYQRDYRWSDEEEYKIVTQLLLDIDLRFKNNWTYNKRNNAADLPRILGDVTENFKPYFLNTIMLNEQSGNIYIVDGQQRLTTILLILIKLYHVGKNNPEVQLNVDKIIGELIYEEGMAGEKDFKISNPDRNGVIRDLFDEATIGDERIHNITQKNLRDNYVIISTYYDSYFKSANGSFDAVAYHYYVYNLLQKVLIIEQVIKHKEDVAMIFETANDRGKELDPHEVLKGMLLGVLDVDTKEECNRIWNDALTAFFNLDASYKRVDDFFRTYFRAKYADTGRQYEQFAGKYHRNLLSNERIIADLDRTRPEKIVQFLRNDLQYFYKTYLEVLGMALNGSNIHMASNHANEQGNQYLLILSALTYNDPEREEKIELVARKLDQFFTLSSLLGAGDSNDRQRLVYELTRAIRNKPLAQLHTAFDGVLVPFFQKQKFPIKELGDLFDYKYFERAQVDGRFSKYLLARVDLHLADLLKEHSPAKQDSLHFITHSGNKPVMGYHIEHMFSNNDLIMEQFVDEHGEFDEKLFIDERNRLGAVILLKGNENIRTSNAVYKKKMSSYRNSGFLWNRMLTNGINQASLNSCTDSIKEQFKSYEPDEEGLLTRDAIDERQRLLFELIKQIYSN